MWTSRDRRSGDFHERAGWPTEVSVANEGAESLRPEASL